MGKSSFLLFFVGCENWILKSYFNSMLLVIGGFMIFNKKVKEIEPSVDALFDLFHLMVSPLYFVMWLGLLLLIQKNFTSMVLPVGGFEEYVISGGIATMIFGKRKILALSAKKAITKKLENKAEKKALNDIARLRELK